MDRATPNLPSRDLDATAQFYDRLGFRTTFKDEGWLIVERGTLQIEFFPWPDLDPRTTIASCCLRVDALDALHAVFAATGLPNNCRSTPRLTEPRDQPWGLREFALVDPDGNLLRCLAPVSRPPAVTLPNGASVPDWTPVTTTMGKRALQALFDALIGPKWSGLDHLDDQVRRLVLEGYAADGRAPSALAIAAAESLSVEDVDRSLGRLAARDLIVLDEGGGVLGAYPFTDHSDHRVVTAGGAFAVMCAIDALGAGAMLQRDSAVHSACRHCRKPLHIATTRFGADLDTVEPASTVVWSGEFYADDCAAVSLCTVQAFFCNDEHLELWRAAGSDGARPGVRLTVAEALQVGRAIFEPMLRAATP